MKNKKVLTMPGVVDTDTPVLTEDHFKIEEALVTDLEKIILKYNGRVSNVAIIGAFQLYANMISLGSLEVMNEDV
jgi:hypothetical protein